MSEQEYRLVIPKMIPKEFGGVQGFHRNDEGKVRPRYNWNQDTPDKWLIPVYFCPECGEEVNQDLPIITVNGTRWHAHCYLKRPKKVNRSHEECADCNLEEVEPARCNGHVSGPSPCSKFVPFEKELKEVTAEDHYKRVRNFIEQNRDIFQGSNWEFITKVSFEAGIKIGIKGGKLRKEAEITKKLEEICNLINE